jgi:acyl-CoA synthetase (AMP-forming)/AMP-acid ligase II
MDAPEHRPGATYIEALVARLAAAGDAPVLRREGADVTAAELLASIHRHARALASVGVGRESLVALFAPNRPEALAVRYAANLLGAASVFLSAPTREDHRAALLAQMDPTLLVVFAETAGLVPAGTTVPVAAVGVAADGAVRLDELAAAQPAAPVACSARPGDLGVIISSGGTTGVPHGSWRSFAAYTAVACVPSPADRRQLVNGRLAYLSQVLVDTTLLGGGCVVLRDRYDAADTLAAIERERITDLFLVEPQLFEVMDHADVARRDLSSLRRVVHVGASAPPVLRMRARARLGPVVAHTYGASEMGLVSVLPPAEHDPARPETFSSAGHLLPGVELRLRRADGGEAAAGEAGVVEVRSAAMACGYRNRPDEEAAVFLDGWFRSGDLGLRDAAGCLRVLGRATDMIPADGTLLGPVMLEEALCRLPDVRYAAVVAEPGTGRWVAAVEAWPGGRVDLACCRRAIVDTHGADVAASVVFRSVGRVPLTEQGKPDRVAIRRLASPDVPSTAERHALAD